MLWLPHSNGHEISSVCRAAGGDIFLVIGTRFYRDSLRHNEWFYEVRDEVEQMIEHCPPDIELQRWNYMIGWTLNLHGNCG
jgi:hypothetical protein